MPQSHSPNQNHLLGALPTDEFERIAPHLVLVPMRLGDIIYEPGEQLQHAYFPTTSIVSLHYVTESGASAETAGEAKKPSSNWFSARSLNLAAASMTVVLPF